MSDEGGTSGASSEVELVSRAGPAMGLRPAKILQLDSRRLFYISRGIMRSDSEAEHTIQEGYDRAFTHLDSFRGDSASRLGWRVLS